jgi:hypothetical protein
VVPPTDLQWSVYLAPLRDVGLAVLVAVELKNVLAPTRTVFSGATRDAAAAGMQRQADVPP